ncbi:hypothetical protein CVT26_015510 [Gymnopilus dilepis]|uniref:Reelin domain-containing protein n=1 Tax=Gymnopilus dilepis TaxID=231916 RepID=A0A409WA50_9AGAR|nr:hypothetical protein CVT26_015510 [Gymnopilus dilepis]
MRSGRLAAVSLYLFFLTLFILQLLSSAQSVNSFQWSLAASSIVKSSQTVGELIACDAVAIIVNGNGTLSDGQGPYYMTAYALGGAPRTTFIGSGGNLEWTVDQPVGSKVVLSIVDSEGNLGNSQESRIFTVTGGSKQCDTTTPGSNFTVRARGMSPRKLAACRPWEIQWSGGTAPYTVTLMAFEQSGLKMMKFMRVNETKFTFINTFNPNSLLIGNNEQWASGTPSIKTKNKTTNTSCQGRQDHAGPLTHADFVNTTLLSANSPRSDAERRTIIALSITLALLISLVCGIIAYRKWRQRRDTEESFTIPMPYSEPFRISPAATETRWLRFLPVRSYALRKLLLALARIDEEEAGGSASGLRVGKNDPELPPPPYAKDIRRS